MKLRATEKSSDSLQTLTKFLYLLISKNKITEAQHIMNDLKKHGIDDPVVGCLHAITLSLGGDRLAALQAIDEVIQKSPQHHMAHYHRCEFLYFCDRIEQAHQELTQLLINIKPLSGELIDNLRTLATQLKGMIEDDISWRVSKQAAPKTRHRQTS